MSTAARIDELRKKFEENPRRFFAPLANELRKAGDVAQAIALCREHLPKQPGHMSGYIVFGQALFDAGELAEARAVFEQAVGLDPENLIALRQLGDIARREGAFALARRWYERVLETDPRNEEIAAAIAELVTPAAPMAAITPVDAVPAIAVPTPVVAAAMTPIDVPAISVPTPVVSAALTPVDVPALPPLSDLEPAAAALDDPFVFGDAELAAPDAADAMSAHSGRDEETGDAHGAGEDDVLAEPLPFEEGLVAPTWPDTADIVARSLSPRTATPLSTPVPPEVAAAFGPLPEERPPVVLPDPEPELPVDLDLVVADVEEAGPPLSVEEVIAERGLTPRYLTPLDTPLASSTELPWIAEPVSAPSAEVEAIMEAIAEDARASGEHDAVQIFALPERPTPPVSAAVASFADVITDGMDPVEQVQGDHDVIETEADVVMEDVALDDLALEDVVSHDVEAVDEAQDDEALDAHAIFPPADDHAFVTETMGELLVAQGFTDRAITVFEELVRRAPSNPALANRLAELKARQLSENPGPVRTARAQFAALAARRVERPFTPPRATVAVATPTTSATPTPASAAPYHTPRASESLALLFGAEVDPASDAAARELAAAFADDAETPASPGLFSGGYAAQPARASRPTPAVPILTPTETRTPQASAPVDPFSFDRFFPDPAVTASAAPTVATPGVPQPTPTTPPAGADPQAIDDLAQFTAWLKGLGTP